MKLTGVADMLCIEASLREASAGCGRVSGPNLSKWRKRCAAANRDDLVALIDREMERRKRLTGGPGSLKPSPKEYTMTWEGRR